MNAALHFFKLAVVAGVVFAAALAPARAEDAAKDAEPTPLEIAQSDVNRMPPPDALLLNAIRYLMQPGYEQDAFESKITSPSPLRPFEQPAASYNDIAQQLRLLALLRSGLPISPEHLAAHAAAYRQAALPSGGEGLASYAIDLLLTRELLPRVQDHLRGALTERANNLLDAAEGRRDLTRQRHDNVLANIMWRVTMLRTAELMGLGRRDGNSRSDFATLMNLHDRRDAFDRDAAKTSVDRLDTNVIGLTALAMYAACDSSLLNNSQTRQLERIIEPTPELVTELQTTFRAELFADVRGLLANSLPANMTPRGRSVEDWRRAGNLEWAFTRTGNNRINHGGISSAGTLPDLLAVVTPNDDLQRRMAITTGLSVIALSGGLLPEAPGPLHDRDLGEIGRAMFAFSVVHAAQGAGDGMPFHLRVGQAIDRGCEFLLSIQNDDGSFPGAQGSYIGNTAIALLALLYGGIDRDHVAIQRGFDWMSRAIHGERTSAVHIRRGNVGTYSAGLILMAYQKYYEPEQRRTGVSSPTSPQQYRQARGRMRSELSSRHRSAIDEVLGQLNGEHTPGVGWHYGYSHSNGADNSNTQYAMLGYKAACLLGCEVPNALFLDEARRLLDSYIPAQGMSRIEVEYSDGVRSGGKTAVVRRRSIVPGGWSYAVRMNQLCGRSMQMTAAGLGTLAICLDELDVRGVLNQELAQGIVTTMKGAEVYMMSKFPDVRALENNDYQMLRRCGDGWGIYYNLYAVERACVLAHIRKMGGEIDWYRVGAEALVEAQEEDGSWSSNALPRRDGQNNPALMRPHVVNIAKAILFLRRAAMPVITEHRRIEREKDPLDENDRPPAPPETGGPITGR